MDLIGNHTQMFKTYIGFTIFSLKDIEKSFVFFHFRSQLSKKHWFNCVFAANIGLQKGTEGGGGGEGATLPPEQERFL